MRQAEWDDNKDRFVICVNRFIFPNNRLAKQVKYNGTMVQNAREITDLSVCVCVLNAYSNIYNNNKK